MTDIEIVNEMTRWLALHFPHDLKSSWYLGIASNIQDRLFGDHQVHPQDHVWIHQIALNDAHARSAEATLLNMGYDGGSSGGGVSTRYVYAFRKDIGTVR